MHPPRYTSEAHNPLRLSLLTAEIWNHLWRQQVAEHSESCLMVSINVLPCFGSLSLASYTLHLAGYPKMLHMLLAWHSCSLHLYCSSIHGHTVDFFFYLLAWLYYISYKSRHEHRRMAVLTSNALSSSPEHLTVCFIRHLSWTRFSMANSCFSCCFR